MTASAKNGSPLSQESGSEQDPNRWRALWVTLVAGFMSLLDVTIVAVALPTVQRELHASAAQVQWVVSGYALTFALALVTAGRLGDALDRRRIFLLALSSFVVFSAACGAAPDITWLVVARLAQGLAAGFMAPQNSALIQQMFRGAERGRAFGFFGATVGISSAVGPLTGGAILALASGSEGWRWIFYVNVPIGILAVLLGHAAAAPHPAVRPGTRGRTRRAAPRSRCPRAHVPAGPGGLRRAGPPVVAVPPRHRAARRLRAVAASSRRPGGPATARSSPVHHRARLRRRRRGRHPVLHRLQRGLAGLRPVLSGRARLLAAAVRPRRHTLRHRIGERGRRRRADSWTGSADCSPCAA